MKFKDLRKTQLIEQKLSEAIFRVDHSADSHITFTPEIAENYTVVHTPIQQLFEFYHRWGGMLPVEIRIRKDPIEVKERVRIYDKLIGSPYDLFVSLDGIETERDIKNVVRNSERAAMLGAIGVPSIYYVITWLGENEFRGNLDVYDISSVPLKIAELYQRRGLLNSPLRVSLY